MQLNVEVHNYMETLVGQVIAQDKYAMTYNHDQLADLACLALSQLRPIYIRFDIDFLSALPEERLVILKEHAQTAVEAAESMIIDDRRKHRDSDIPIVMSQTQFDEDAELEWYEKPILGHKQHNLS
ncbi:late competence development ComFB family protein [Vibrio sp. Y2-5]|uniref:late competence development ComFB family protein n=1 Tax=Vibrio TaxID=662 RepID=UPI00142DCADF|nr:MULTISPECIES: late competence development ComFB family protein [Vibrio]MBD0787230.1 late competence development ComFB family protein [Vibrio sp. Y2-5]NIY94040.1 late competence development ComFB family protein [Vibrio diazotrophicus]